WYVRGDGPDDAPCRGIQLHDATRNNSPAGHEKAAILAKGQAGRNLKIRRCVDLCCRGGSSTCRPELVQEPGCPVPDEQIPRCVKGKAQWAYAIEVSKPGSEVGDGVARGDGDLR